MREKAYKKAEFQPRVRDPECYGAKADSPRDIRLPFSVVTLYQRVRKNQQMVQRSSRRRDLSHTCFVNWGTEGEKEREDTSQHPLNTKRKHEVYHSSGA